MFARWFAPDQTPVIHRGNLILRGPRPADYDTWRTTRLSSRAFLKPYEPRWSETDLSRKVYKRRLKRARRESIAGNEFTFFIWIEGGAGAELAGGMTLSNIRRRVAQQANLGYWMAADHARKGIMSQAVAAILPFVFDELQLNRINAACLPDNLASRRVLEKNGFREEGYAENYLQIDGSWRDHVLFALTRQRYLASSVTGDRQRL